MTGRTHLAGGAASLWLLALVPGNLAPEVIGPTVLAACVGGLLPDLDASESLLKNVRVGY